MLALANVLGYAESRAEDLSGYKDDGEEDPSLPGADEAWAHVRYAQAQLGAVQPPDWRPEAADWVGYCDVEDDKAMEVLAQVLEPCADNGARVKCDDGRVVVASRRELRLLARPTEAERGGLALVAESPTDPLNSNNYVLQVPDGGADGEALWISVGGAALQLRIHGDGLSVSSHPNGEEDASTWAQFDVEAALAADSKPSP
ncbi:hypothetical protein CSC66_08935 [Pseudoxanthomonas kaohsiungensis]|nr:hypothetical protein CSC66_08935 [Pseudoxanthomonas kaohsiungensis]